MLRTLIRSFFHLRAGIDIAPPAREPLYFSARMIPLYPAAGKRVVAFTLIQLAITCQLGNTLGLNVRFCKLGFMFVRVGQAYTSSLFARTGDLPR